MNYSLTEILRVSGMVSNQGFSVCNQLQHRSRSAMATPNLISNAGGTTFAGWRGPPQEDESHDYYKRQQLRELAVLKSGLRDDKKKSSSQSRDLFHPIME
ncbi:hypothetical protein GW17_00053752 [Ensete ventricosum]|nr:hypothetical protein GW17_00053752 [Ensete ventricosum]